MILRRVFLVFIFCLLIGNNIPNVFGMNSDNYKVAPDVIDEAGGVSTDGTYNLYHNFGESAVTGEGTSANYKIFQGFLQPDVDNLYITISKPNINFGKMLMSQVSSDSVDVNLGINSNKGYSLVAYDNTLPGLSNGLIDGLNKIVDATNPNNFIALPLAGTEHYGIVVTGVNADSGYANGTKINSLDNTTWAKIGSYDNKTKNDTYNVEYRAGISEDTPSSSNYSATTTFILTVNY